MNVSPEEAREALESVRSIERRARGAIRLAGGGAILMIWGVAWLVGNLGGSLLEADDKGAIWAVVNTLGALATFAVVGRVSARVRNPLGPRIGLLWLFLFGDSGLWIWIAQPTGALEIGFLASTIAMFGR